MSVKQAAACIGGVNAIKYNCIAHSPAKRESNTIRNTADVSILEMFESVILCMVMDFFFNQRH